ncbi:Inositol-1-monophosphatase [Candidatus Hartigia pinicola]|nr:Inositol-1-monophosphatase [Candidatus Hartigia pinicola]
MHPILNIAIRAARKASNHITKSYEMPNNVQITKKGANDFVTNIDHECEHLIIEVIRQYYPEHTIFSEESGELLGKNNNIQWVIDPLDGTTNFTKNFPHFAISIAVRIHGRTEVAVVYDPMRNELFSAVRGQGSQLNGYRLRGADARELKGAIIATGFPFKYKQHAVVYMNIMRKIFERCADFRRTGSSALDLCYIAAGRVDAYFEIGLKPWDFMGGELIMRESGGIITDFIGNHNYLISGNLVAGSPRIVQHMLFIMRNELSEVLKC